MRILISAYPIDTDGKIVLHSDGSFKKREAIAPDVAEALLRTIYTLPVSEDFSGPYKFLSRIGELQVYFELGKKPLFFVTCYNGRRIIDISKLDQSVKNTKAQVKPLPAELDKAFATSCIF